MPDISERGTALLDRAAEAAGSDACKVWLRQQLAKACKLPTTDRVDPRVTARSRERLWNAFEAADHAGQSQFLCEVVFRGLGAIADREGLAND